MFSFSVKPRYSEAAIRARELLYHGVYGEVLTEDLALEFEVLLYVLFSF
jgi:hypothetical protein